MIQDQNYQQTQQVSNNQAIIYLNINFILFFQRFQPFAAVRIIIYKMSNKIFTVPIGEDYPFGTCTGFTHTIAEIHLRKIIEGNSQSLLIIKEKIRMLQILGSHHLVKLLYHTQEANDFILSFEQVSTKFQGSFQNFSDEIVQKIKKQLIQLSLILSNHYVDHTLNFKNVGMDNEDNLKYYLGFNFKIDRNMDKQEIFMKYRQQVADYFGINNSVKEVIMSSISTENEEKNRYLETMDSFLKEGSQKNRQSDNYMNKSRTYFDSPERESQIKQKEKTTTFYSDQHIFLSVQECKNEEPGLVPNAKPLKNEHLEAKINELKYAITKMKDKTSKNSYLMGSLTDRVNNCNAESWNNSQSPTKVPIYVKSSSTAKNKEEYTNSMTGNRTISIKESIQSAQSFNNQPALVVPKSPKSFNKCPNIIKQCNQISVEQINSMDIKRQQKEYIQLASNDKYCSEFLNFLEGDQTPPPTKNDAMNLNFNLRNTRAITKKVMKTERSDGSGQIHCRVRDLINKSMKAMTNLRSKEAFRIS